MRMTRLKAPGVQRTVTGPAPPRQPGPAHVRVDLVLAGVVVAAALEERQPMRFDQVKVRRFGCLAKAQIGLACAVALRSGRHMRRASEPESRDRLLRRRAVPWLISVAILTFLATSGAAAETKRVLMLFSNDSLLPAGDAISSSFRSSLQAENPDRVEVFTEFLDADRFPGPAHEARMELLLRDKYASIPIDLRVAIGPQALDFLSQRRESLFPGTPLIFAGVSEASIEQQGVPPEQHRRREPFRSGADVGAGAAIAAGCPAGRRGDRRLDLRPDDGTRWRGNSWHLTPIASR